MVGMVSKAADERVASPTHPSEDGLTNVGIASRFRAAFSRENLNSIRSAILHNSLEALTLIGLTTFFLFYGLVPIFGGAGLGLVGADEPRYAQVAREMLARHDFVTPILYGQPWLEKPALYYWRAMFAFREFGVHDWSARLPSASFAFTLVVLIYLHMRRFRHGGQLDAALITASCAGIIAFARGASTDMQLAAPFCIGMLGWYAWYETDSKFWLFDLYFFVGAATLAKGPVAPFMAMAIILAFTALRREWSLLRRSIWFPGIALYLAMVLPWFIAVQHRNPDFLRVFFLEHNLQRFATDLYEHEQAHVVLLPGRCCSALTPWAVIAIAALADARPRSPSPNGAPAAPRSATSASPAPATPSPNSSSSGRSSPSSSSPSRSPSCPATCSPPSLPSPSLPAITSTASASRAFPLAAARPRPGHRNPHRRRPAAPSLPAASRKAAARTTHSLPLASPASQPPLLILVTVARFGLERLRIATLAPMSSCCSSSARRRPLLRPRPRSPAPSASPSCSTETYSARPL